MTNTRRWATKEEVAEHIRVSVKTVQRMTARGELTAHNVGPRLIRYDLNEIDAMLTPTNPESAVR
ncbi:helix-turn-helix domain-containing protein [Mycobacterium dioxanotrophicus]|uniref:helix-turn-helix domain-containing protein n=1 Tax=Mycobacterium dioxanotrophicus TaxID=482462 RepID=UPI001E40DA2F|nr:helix-turn-helix domain-containing protein [Mycobacterium dioxanotrophicus]